MCCFNKVNLSAILLVHKRIIKKDCTVKNNNEVPVDMLLSCTKFSSVTGGALSCPVRAILLAASRPVCVSTSLRIYLVICNNLVCSFESH